MAGGGQWEIVGGGKAKKTKTKGNKASAKEKTNGAPAFEASAPIQESHTIYTALLEKPPAPAKVTDSSKDKGLPPLKKKKGGGDKKTPPKVTLEDVFAAVSEEDLKNHLATLEVLCPASPLLWLKDLASFLNVKVDVSTEEPAFASKPTGYPSTLLNKAVYKKIVGMFNRCTPQMLQIFYEFCLQNLVQDTLKGLHTMGYQVMLQLVAHASPSVALGSLSKCSELCQSHQNRQNICLSVLWAAGQAGNSDLEAGLKVWLELMFPLIAAKNCTAYVVDYLEKLTRMDGAAGRCSKSLVDVRDLFPILDFIHCKDVGKGMQKRLLALYPTLKRLSYGPEPETALRNYFPSYLRRLEPQCPQPLKEEILDSLMLCLEKDERCYSIWRQLYIKHFVQSKLLISHLNDQWSGVPPKFPRRCLRDTLSVFQVTNEELLSSGRRNLQDVEECTLVNKELLSKINAGSFSWPRFLFIAILLISSLLTCDILAHGSFADSVSGKLMKDYGLLLVFAQAGEKLAYFYGRVQTLVQQYHPPAFQWLHTTLVPLLDLLFRKVCSAAAVAWYATSDLRSWCGTSLPPLLASAEGVFVTHGTALLSALGEAAVFVSKHLLNAFSVLLDSAESLALWIQANPQIMDALGTVKQFSLSLAENVQRNALHVFQVAKEYVPLPA